MNREEAIRRMNEWGGTGRPFFFLVDFASRCPLVLPLDELTGQGIRLQMPSDLEKPLPRPNKSALRPTESRPAVLTGVQPSNRPLDPVQVVLPSVEPSPRPLASVQADLNPSKPSAQPFEPILPVLEHDGYPFEAYRRQFEQVMQHIRSGDSFLTNLTCCTPVRSRLGLDALFDRVEARYKLLYQDHFLCFSPETFVRIHDGIISSNPMKGTMDASLPDALERLLGNPKETAEHSTIVDLIRNDLSMVAHRVRVERFRYVETIPAGGRDLLQMSSEICGELPADALHRLGDILFALLPAGSVSGAPKRKTVEIIQQTETYDRGYYTGVFGVFDGKSLDSAVLIRFLEQTDDGLVYKSGGGITSQSQLNDEYDEMLRKIYAPVH